MEDATISRGAEESQAKSGIPSLVSDDDLKREIGEWVVSGLNKDILIKRLATHNASINGEMTRMAEELKQIDPLKRSNVQIEEKNKALAEAAETARKEAKEAIAAVKADAKAEISAIRSEAKSEANEVSAELKARDNTIDELKSKLKKARADLRRKT